MQVQQRHNNKGAGPAACSLFAMRLFLPLHVDDGLQHLVTYGDDFGAPLEAALGDEHVGEFVGIDSAEL